MKLDTLIGGHEENCSMQEPNPVTSIYGVTSLFNFFSKKACPEHISESIEGKSMT